MDEAAVPEIQWFRTNYVVPEDRLRVACSLRSGDSDVFWLTQRLANVLLKNLLAWLDETVPSERAAEVAHRMAQQTAAATAPKRRTEKLPDAPGWLVHSIDIRKFDERVLLTFKGSEGQAARIGFNAEHLRRWLTGLYGQYRRSGWPTDLWPAWITEPAEEEAAGPSGLLH